MSKKLPFGMKQLRLRKGETELEFNLRKAVALRAAAEAAKTKRESDYASNHPSDNPLVKFARVWEKKGKNNAAYNGGEKAEQGGEASQGASPEGS